MASVKSAVGCKLLCISITPYPTVTRIGVLLKLPITATRHNFRIVKYEHGASCAMPIAWNLISHAVLFCKRVRIKFASRTLGL